MSSSWDWAAGRARAIQAEIPLCAPTSGNTDSISPSTRARINAKWPSSGIMVHWPPSGEYGWGLAAFSASLTSGGM